MDKQSAKPKPLPPMPDPKRTPYQFAEWVLLYQVRKRHVTGIPRPLFRRWLLPQSPAYSKELDDAVHSFQWDKTAVISKELIKAFRGKEGLYATEHGKPSNHEFVIRDIFFLLGIMFEYQYPVTLSDKREIIVDFYLPDTDRYFEIFGSRREGYAEEAYEKATKLRQKLWWLNLMIKSHAIGENATLLSYATMLDSDICYRKKCGMGLFPFSVTERLNKKIPLLTEGLSMCRNYLIQMGQLNDQQRANLREDVDMQEPAAYDIAPAYEPPNRNIIHPLKPKTASSAPSLQQIEASLKGMFKSVDMWTDEEKVAVYFHTPQNLMKAMGGMARTQNPLRIGPETFEPRQLAARNWYQAIKLAASLNPDNVLNDLFNVIRSQMSGEWKVIGKQEWPKGRAYHEQRSGFLELIADNVKAANDKFYTKIFYIIRTKANQKKLEWNQERYLTDDRAESVSAYDSGLGHRLLYFHGFVEGKKPDILSTPKAELDIMGTPEVHRMIDAFRTKDRQGMVRIGDFEQIDTPIEVANQINTIIDRFYRDDNEDKGPEPIQPVSPKGRVPVGAS